jgi:energy-coupling factor transporter ATP-binding protein EcfA2
MSIKSVLVYGPHGCGKSTHANEIAKALGLNKIHDDWEPGTPFDMLDTLILTNDCQNHSPFTRRLMSFDQAMQIVQHGGEAA